MKIYFIYDKLGRAITGRFLNKEKAEQYLADMKKIGLQGAIGEAELQNGLILNCVPVLVDTNKLFHIQFDTLSIELHQNLIRYKVAYNDAQNENDRLLMLKIEKLIIETNLFLSELNNSAQLELF